MKRSIKATVIGLTIFGASVAAAATLPITADNLAAGDTVVSACQTGDIHVEYSTAYNDVLVSDSSGEPGTYELTALHLSGFEQDDPGTADGPCQGQDMKITIADADGAELTEVDGSVDFDVAGEQDVTVDDDVPAEEVGAISVVISG